MNNCTRDPQHQRASEYFVPNFHELTIKVDGQVIDNSSVRDAYPLQDYIHVFIKDGDDYVLGANRLPTVERIDGIVEVIGESDGCTPCAIKKRRIARWWLRIGDPSYRW